MIVQVRDGRGQAANATVSITIIRDPTDIPPRFTDTTFDKTIRFDQPINVDFYKVNAEDQDLKVIYGHAVFLLLSGEILKLGLK